MDTVQNEDIVVWFPMKWTNAYAMVDIMEKFANPSIVISEINAITKEFVLLQMFVFAIPLTLENLVNIQFALEFLPIILYRVELGIVSIQIHVNVLELMLETCVNILFVGVFHLKNHPFVQGTVLVVLLIIVHALKDGLVLLVKFHFVMD
jgi:hypothetical protein